MCSVVRIGDRPTLSHERLSFDRSAAEEWISDHISPTGEVEVAHDQSWAIFKACGLVQRFEPYLTRVQVVTCDEQRS